MCGCAPASDFSVGGCVWFLGLARVAVYFSAVMGESCVSVLDVGVRNRWGGMCVASFPFQARPEGSGQMGTPQGAGCGNES